MKNKLKIWVTILAIFPLLANAQTWELKSGFPNNNGHHHPVTWAIDGFGYAATGTSELTGVSKDFYRYDPATDTWTPLPAFPGVARSFSIGAVYDGKGYLGFGSSDTSFLNDLWRYDPQTQTWTQLSSCPCSGRQHPAFVVNNEYHKIYMGLGNSNHNFKDWWEYDIATDTWTRKPNFPSTARHHPVEFSIDGYTYVGLGDDHDTNNASQEFFRYDPATDTWAQMASAPDGIGRIASAQFEYNGFGFISDGDGSHHLGTNPTIFWRYNPTANQWDVLTPHSGNSLFAPGAFVINGIAYVIGGVDRSVQPKQYLHKMWVVSLDSLTQTGINQIEKNKLTFNIYPNPVKNKLTIENLNQQLKRHTVLIYDVLGQVNIKQNLNGSRKQQLDISGLANGVYLLKIISPEGDFKSFKFLKE